VPESRWQWVTVDFITDLPETKAGHTVVSVDWLSKMVHFAPCWNDMGAGEFAQVFVREILRLQDTTSLDKSAPVYFDISDT